MESVDLILFLSIGFVVSVGTAMSGFGAGPTSILLLGLFMSPQNALISSGMIVISTSLSKLYQFRNHIVFHDFLVFSPVAVFGAVISSFVSLNISNEILDTSIVIAISIVLALELITFRGKKGVSTKNNLLSNVFSGSVVFVSGVFSGISHAAGGLLVAAIKVSERSRYEVIGTVAAIAFFMNISKQIVYGFNSSFYLDTFVYFVFLMPVCLLGTFLGKNILSNFINEELFDIIHVLLLVLLLIFSLFY